ncbi:hypothetical protein D3C72_1713490 [compost metagenome]
MTGLDDHHRHGHVDAGHRHPVEHIQGVAGGEKLAGLAAGRIEEGQLHRGRAARHAIDDRVALVADFAVGRQHVGGDEGASVEVANAHPGGVAGCLDQALLDSKRADGAEHVAAVGRRVDPTLGHHDLDEQVIDVRLGMQRRADDRDLAGLRAAAADAVNLQFVTGAHHREQQLIALFNADR